MFVTVRDLEGLPGVPASRWGVFKWLETNGVPKRLTERQAVFRISDLPADVRLAYLQRQLDGLGIDQGEYDEAAHRLFMEAAPARRERAERKAQVAAVLVSLGKLVPCEERLQIIHARFGEKGHSKARLKAILNAVKGVDPINFAPALLDGNTNGGKRCDVSTEAWQFFMTLIAKAAPDWPLISAWRDVRDVAEIEGWDWPAYPTIWRRWNELPEAQRLEAREGKRAASKALAMPALRDKTSISALEWVSLDGRTQDFWVITEDGKTVRPTMLALVDVATNKVLDFELAPSENAVATVRLIKRTCETYGIFDRLYTDNGSAFAGHLVAGGNPHKFRNAKGVGKVQPMGICKIMGIDLTFALPANAQAKIAERAFASLSRVIDDRPEFKGAHTGQKPGASPDTSVSPVPIETAMAVIQREIRRHNTEAGRRAQGARGRSYDQVFEDQMQHRTRRQPTVRQLYLAGLVWKPVAVDRWGRVTVNGWTYGGHSTQDALLRFHGRDKRILLGRDPQDFNAPAMAYDEDGHLICEGIEPVQRGKYGSVDGIRDAARNRKAARQAVKAAEAANDYLEDHETDQLLAKLDAQIAARPNAAPQGNGVLAPEFKTPLRDKAKAKPEEIQAVPAEFYKNMDAALSAKWSERSKSA